RVLSAINDLGVQVYPGLVARQRERRLLLEARLPQALADGSVTAVGQPIVDLRTGAVVAVEALARWDDDLLGQVPPAEFVVVAERSGLVPELGRCVLRSAVEGYREHGLVGSGLRLAVNVSPLELRGPGYIDGLAEVLARTGMPARDLVVEVTEAVVIEAGDPAVRVLSAINDLGVQVAIDDFGTGYSALGYLRRLPVQALKVDKSLVGEALTSVRTRQIVSGVVDLARRLGLVVTREGIEDGDTARLAVDLGADQGQGYWFGRPVTWDLVALAASQERPGAAAG
ncbi:MAG: EAL domain-containing protein, partial [Actinobacteria bacterium]|nr:EAL domain-containing protein [Actinomycetota bacterium]